MREQGADVYGFGAQKTPESFRQACRRFIYTENLVPRAASSGTNAAAKPNRCGPQRRDSDIAKGHFADRKRGWMGSARPVGEQLSNLFSDFDVRTYG